MKKIARMIFFSGAALYLTQLWNKGLIIEFDLRTLFFLVLGVAVLNYIINPILKMILFPLNIITFGSISLIIYFLLFHFLVQYFPVIKITNWVFQGYHISYLVNVGLIATSVSFIINFLEMII
mgnify:CR=1 FL=1